jgi:hypothetical protein
MRMSLSFPLLLGAVPLYTIKAESWLRKKGKKDEILKLQITDFQRHWFSDGGICSNFPIHFFDNWLPGRPTFGINLTAFGPEEFEQKPTGSSVTNQDTNQPSNAECLKMKQIVAPPQHLAPLDDNDDATELNDATESVYLPRANATPVTVCSDISTLFSFGGAIFSTAQNYRDMLQSQLPSYRERIANIRLKSNEGGLNLDMTENELIAVRDKGAAAGAKLIERYTDEEGFDHHCWVRFLVLMSQLESQLIPLQTQLNQNARYRELLGKQADASFNYPYRVGDNKPDFPEFSNSTIAILDEMSNLLTAWNPPQTFKPHCPRPEATLRFTPDV